MDNFISHVGKRHVSENRYQCGICDNPINFANVRSHLPSHRIGEYQCLYCPFGSCTLDGIRNHMADSHSARLMFACVRKCRKDKDVKNVSYFVLLPLFSNENIDLINIFTYFSLYFCLCF